MDEKELVGEMLAIKAKFEEVARRASAAGQYGSAIEALEQYLAVAMQVTILSRAIRENEEGSVKSIIQDLSLS